MIPHLAKATVLMDCDTAILAAGALPVAGRLGTIFYQIVLPILLLVGIGWLLQRRGGLDMRTMTRLNFYFVVPVLIFVKLVTSPVSGADVGKVVGFCAAMMAALAGVTYLVAVVRRVPSDQRRAMLMTTMFYNSGNYGLPLQELASRSLGAACAEQAGAWQVFVILSQNLANFTAGVLLAAGGRGAGQLKRSLGAIVRFPPIYTLIAGLATVGVLNALGCPTPQDTPEAAPAAIRPFWQALLYIKGAFFAVALVTLGAQLGSLRASETKYPVTLSVLLRLLVGPALGLGLIHALGLTGHLAQVMLISTAMPTAVNCMLLCLQFDNHPDFAARSVFYSTLLSPVTVTLTIFLAQGGLLARFAT